MGPDFIKVTGRDGCGRIISTVSILMVRGVTSMEDGQEVARVWLDPMHQGQPPVQFDVWETVAEIAAMLQAGVKCP